MCVCVCVLNIIVKDTLSWIGLPSVSKVTDWIQAYRIAINSIYNVSCS